MRNTFIALFSFVVGAVSSVVQIGRLKSWLIYLKSTFGLMTLCLFLASCVGGSNYFETYGTSIEKVEHTAWAGILYKGYEHIKADVESKAKVGLWDEDRLKSAIESIPAGGYVVITVYASSIEFARPQHWEFMATDLSDNVIKRRAGISSVNNVPTYEINEIYGTIWSAIDIFHLDNPPPSPFKFYVFDNVGNKRNSYLIYPNKIIRE